MTPSVLLFADGSPAIGLGHIRRAMVLGRLFQDQGARVLYAVPDGMVDYLAQRGIPHDQIRSQSDDLSDASHIVTDINWNGNARQAARQIAGLTASAATVTVIDSMPPDHFVADPGGAPDLVVTPYLHGDQHRDAPDAADWLAGGRVAILDPALPIAAAITPASPPRILVSCGGSDPDGLSLRILDALAEGALPVDLIVGPLFLPELTAQLKARAPQTFTLHHAPDGLTDLLAASSLVIGRVGLLRYEAAVLGKHGIYLQSGSAYRAYLEGFAASGIAEVFFTDPGATPTDFLNRIQNLTPADFAPNPRAASAVDGKGAQRVVQAVLNLKKAAR